MTVPLFQWLSFCVRQGYPARALMGSPCDPVVIRTTFLSGRTLDSADRAFHILGNFQISQGPGDVDVIDHALPSKATLRPNSSATSITCWMRTRLEAKQATMIRPGHVLKISRKVRPIFCSLMCSRPVPHWWNPKEGPGPRVRRIRQTCSDQNDPRRPDSARS